jgi:hypothetical protein
MGRVLRSTLFRKASPRGRRLSLLPRTCRPRNLAISSTAKAQPREPNLRRRDVMRSFSSIRGRWRLMDRARRTKGRLSHAGCLPRSFGLGWAIVLIFVIWLLRRREEGTDATTVAKREAAMRPSRRSPRDPLRPQPAPSAMPPMSEESDRLPSSARVQKPARKCSRKLLERSAKNGHPDRARAEKRPLRERRLKQINVAWDILRGKQAVSRA